VRFSIDASQFVAPQDPSDPPRRQVKSVTMGTVAQRTSQAMDGGIVGFHQDAGETARALMIVSRRIGAPDLEPENQTPLGTCIKTDQKALSACLCSGVLGRPCSDGSEPAPRRICKANSKVYAALPFQRTEPFEQTLRIQRFQIPCSDVL
jgi:hypothetical protein